MEKLIVRALVHRTFAILAFGLMLAGCQSDLAALPPLGSAELDNNSYKLGPGDKMSLTVFGVKDLSGEMQVAAEGTVALPLLGNTKAAGLTVDELISSIRQRLIAGYVNDPKVTLQIIEYRPLFILGEVRTPGHYPFIPGMTVTNAVALAGGYTPRAYKEAFRVTRNRVNCRADETSNLLPDDVVTVAERYF